jgi:acetoacetate decarboxylase
MGYKHREMDLDEARKSLSVPCVVLKIIPHVDNKPRILELVSFEYQHLADVPIAAEPSQDASNKSAKLVLASVHSKFVCRARIVSGVSLKRERSLRITSSKAIICAVSNREPMGRTESLPL